MWGKALVLEPVSMVVGIVMGGAVAEKAEIGLVLAKDYFLKALPFRAGRNNSL
ncbi:hypothetical protein PNA2_1938 [Pyrococcus sp. NA2]|uniref:hypothetical protein n=1 Tax=Pyrococcus sp. (strain NA2) TaxID=342949 RepID=UPI000209AD9E|nr:hypothetical protein [Pyrococcus sp. NA2]AEC52852.1 hypothetical protein PNA2_1938 [Pyrococcus sp. NA2]